MAKSFEPLLLFLGIVSVHAFLQSFPLVPSTRVNLKHSLASLPARYSSTKTARYMSEYDYQYPSTIQDESGGPLDSIPVTSLPLDIFDSFWKLDITIQPFDYRLSDDQYQLQFPIHFKLDGTVGIFETDVVMKGHTWKWRSYDSAQYIDFNIDLQGLEVIPDGTYNFNVMVYGNDDDGFMLGDGLVRTTIASIQNRENVPQACVEMMKAGVFDAYPIADMPYELYGVERD
mmetsp:Transcript_20784/g.27348  ORF Transcript_20784/g.27348 Transcript_20784/m.27348 type:complete len:230 (-) Transcript_20784:89-778(-)